MRKNGKYRFTLQFPAETDEQIQAGELLERLGNRKSAVLVGPCMSICRPIQRFEPGVQNRAQGNPQLPTRGYRGTGAEDGGRANGSE